MVGPVLKQHRPGSRAGREYRVHAPPAIRSGGTVRGKTRAELVAVRREVKQRYGRAVRRLPARGVAAGPSCAAVAAPRHDEIEAEPTGEQWERGRMTEGVGRIEDRWRLRVEPPNRAAPREQISDQRLAARNELVSEDVPWARLEHAVAECDAKHLRAIGTHLGVVVEDDRLPVEQKGARVIALEQLVDEGGKALPEPAGGEIPLAVPVRVRDDVYDFVTFVTRCPLRGALPLCRHARGVSLHAE